MTKPRARATYEVLVCFQRSNCCGSLMLQSFYIHNEMLNSSMVTHLPNCNRRCKFPERNQNWFVDKSSIIRSVHKINLYRLRMISEGFYRLIVFLWYSKGFISVLFSPWPKAQKIPLSLQHFQMLVCIKTSLTFNTFLCESLMKLRNLTLGHCESNVSRTKLNRSDRFQNKILIQKRQDFSLSTADHYWFLKFLA